MISFLKFKRGKELLEYTKNIASYGGNAFLPERVFIPLSLIGEKPPNSAVLAGETVREGQAIIRSNNSNIMSVHSSIPGILYDFVKFDLPDGHILYSAAVKLNGSFDILGKPLANYSWRESTVPEMLSVINYAGILNTNEMGTENLSTQLWRARKANCSTLCVNLFDYDPSCGLNSMLLDIAFNEFCEGLGIVAKILEVKKIICIHKFSKNKMNMTEKISSVCSDIEINFIKVEEYYPATTEFNNIGIDKLFWVDMTSLIYAYEVIKTNTPLTSVFVLIGGDAINEPKILRIRIGTPISNLIEECGGFKSEPKNFIVNGLINGVAIDDLTMPVTKTIKSIHFLRKEKIKVDLIDECINCGNCLNSCPYYLEPKFLVKSICKGEMFPEVIKSIEICRECSCCSSSCPARIPLSAIISKAKRNIKKEV